MEKYIRALKSIQEIYDMCIRGGRENARVHWDYACARLIGLKMVAAADRDLTDEEYELIRDFRIKGEEDEKDNK